MASCDSPGQRPGMADGCPTATILTTTLSLMPIPAVTSTKEQWDRITTMGKRPFRQQYAASAQHTACRTTQTLVVRAHCQTRRNFSWNASPRHTHDFFYIYISMFNLFVMCSLTGCHGFISHCNHMVLLSSSNKDLRLLLDLKLTSSLINRHFLPQLSSNCNIIATNYKVIVSGKI